MHNLSIFLSVMGIVSLLATFVMFLWLDRQLDKLYVALRHFVDEVEKLDA